MAWITPSSLIASAAAERSLRKLPIAAVKNLQKFRDFRLCCQVAEADAPRGQRVFPVVAHRVDRPGRRPLHRAGGLHGHADIIFSKLLLKSRPLDAVDAQIQNVRHGVFRTVEADFWILRKLRAQQTIQRRNVCDALVLIFERQTQRLLDRHRHAQCGRAAAIGRGAAAAVDLRLDDKVLLFDQQAATVQAVKLVRRDAHCVHTGEHQLDLPHGLRRVHMEAAVGIVSQNIRDLLDWLHHRQAQLRRIP